MKLKISDLKVSSFITGSAQPARVYGGITGMRCEGLTTPHVCNSQTDCWGPEGCTNYPCFDTGTNPGATALEC